MIISKRGNFIYFANPKTGTTAIENALLPHATIFIGDDPVLKHLGVNQYKKLIEPFLENLGISTNLDRIGVIRHPIEWMISWYKYRKRGADIGTSVSTQNVSFDEFARSFLDKENRPDYARIGSPSGILNEKGAKFGVNYLYAYEALERMAADLSNRLDTKIRFEKRINVSDDYEIDLEPQTEALLIDHFKKDFKRYEAALR